MVANLQIPMDVAKVVEVKDTSEPLRKLLIEIVNKLSILEKEKAALEDRVYKLEHP